MKKRILFVIPSLTQANGIPAFLINYMKNMDLTKFDITILSSNLRPSPDYMNFFRERDIKCFFINDLRKDGFVKYYKSLKNFFKENHKFDLIYSNIANQSLFIFYVAKKYGIKKYAIHSHATMSSSNKLKMIINNIMTNIVLHKTNNYFACSELAGKYMFKNKKFTVINNAIDYDKFKFSKNNRQEIRKKYDISENDFIVGFVGRFAPQKNIYFFINLIKDYNPDLKIMMIGTGTQKNDFVKKCSEYKINDKFIFIDECSDVYKYYSAFDLFILPSNFEGLPVVAIEAQANGLKCLLSDTITKESKILKETEFFDRNDFNGCYDKIKDKSKIIESHFEEKILDDKFNILIQSKKFEKILINLCKE